MGLATRALALIAIASSVARADELATSPARPDYEATDKALMWKGRSDLEDRGLTIDGTYAVEGFVVPSLEDPDVIGGLFTAEIDAELDKLVSKRLGRFHASAFAIHGKGVTNELMDVHGTSGNTAPPDVRLFEAWLDQPAGPLTLRVGLMAADQEFVLSDQSQTLLSATFGITSQFSADVFGPVYPIATPGVSARYEGKLFDVRAAIYDGEQKNRHGIPTDIGESYLVMGEVELQKWILVGGWHHPDRGSAIYAVLDTDVVEGLGVFVRAGHSTAGLVSTYIDAGIRSTVGVWRPDDLVSIGMAYARCETGGETLVEATYELQIDWVTIQPDLQLLILPDRTVPMAATRVTLTF